MKTFSFLFCACAFAVLFSTSCMNKTSTSAGGTDTLAQNKALITKVEMAFTDNDTTGIDSAMSPSMIDHQAPPNLTGTPIHNLNSFMKMFKAAFPDAKTEIKAITAEGNLVSAFGSISGTNSGSFMEMPSTNKKMSMDFADVFRIDNRKVAEHWGILDIAPMMMAADSAKMMKKDKM